MSKLPDTAPVYVQNEGSTRLSLSGLNHTTFDLAVYASQGESPHRHARLASGCWSGFARRDSYPQGFSERFQSSSLFLQSFPDARTPYLIIHGGYVCCPRNPGTPVPGTPRLASRPTCRWRETTRATNFHE